MIELYLRWGWRLLVVLVALSMVTGLHMGMEAWYSNAKIIYITPERQVLRARCGLEMESRDFDRERGYCCPGVPCSYTNEVDFRIIILVFNRADSLSKVLDSIAKIEMDGDSLSVDIWIDLTTPGEAYRKTMDVAKAFRLKQGPISVHVQLQHAGIYGQWINSWRRRLNSKEIALILEDDVDISPYAYRWLKAAHSFYGYRTDIGGISLYEGGIVHMPDLPSDVAFLHQRIGTQGFAPHPEHWRQFQDWYHSIKTNPNFHPYVEDDVTITKWYKKFEQSKHNDTMWEMWWIYYADVNKLWTLYSNLGAFMHARNQQFDNRTYLAYHRQEAGLHFQKAEVRGSADKLITEWNEAYTHFVKTIPQYSYNATIIW